MLRFKVDVMVMLKAKGLSANRLRLEKVFGCATMQKMRHRKIISMNEFDRLCELLGVQPGELIEWVENVEEPGEVRGGE